MYRNTVGRILIFLVFLLFFSFLARADSHITRFIFITEPQSIAVGAISEPLTIQAQDTAGDPVKAGVTVCVGLNTASGMGEFSSNKDNWKPVAVLTINKSWTSRTFYYKDTEAGSYILQADVAVKPENTTCSAWPRDEWDAAVWSAEQTILVGGDQSVESGGVQKEVVAKPSSVPAGGVASPFKSALNAYAGEDRTVATGALVEFVAMAFDADSNPFEASRYWWNFGDGGAEEGRNSNHIFSQVGTYTVGLHISSGISSASDYVTVKVVSNKIAVKNVVTGDGGFVRLENPSEYVIDIGGWHISDAVGVTFTLMPKTKIHSRSEIAFPNGVTGLLQSGNPEVVMYYPNGVKAFEYSVSKPSLAVLAVPIKSEVSPPSAAEKNVVVLKVDAQGGSVDMVEAKSKGEVPQSNLSEALAQVSGSHSTSGKLFFLFAVGLSVLAAVGFLAVKKFMV
jgi:PKD repeat protein